MYLEYPAAPALPKGGGGGSRRQELAGAPIPGLIIIYALTGLPIPLFLDGSISMNWNWNWN